MNIKCILIFLYTYLQAQYSIVGTWEGYEQEEIILPKTSIRKVIDLSFRITLNLDKSYDVQVDGFWAKLIFNFFKSQENIVFKYYAFEQIEKNKYRITLYTESKKFPSKSGFVRFRSNNEIEVSFVVRKKNRIVRLKRKK